jgi:uncharacterized protein with NRDE domain
MCVAAIAWAAHPRWQLVVAGNRDEFHRRPAAPLARWNNGIVAGRDLEAGGTWLGVADGRFALVTNRRAEGWPRPGMASRGGLVTGHLLGIEVGDPAAMNPFNLINAGSGRARLLTNFPALESRDLSTGVHTLSNGGLDEMWFKERRLAAALGAWLAGNDPPQALLAPLADPSPDPDSSETVHSPVFIVNPTYGTRCSSVIAIDVAGHGTIIERSYDATGATTGTVRLEFTWPASP